MTSFGPDKLTHTFELVNVGQGSQLIEWFAQYNIHYGMYPFVHIERDTEETHTPKLIVSFEGDNGIATAFALRWAGRDSKD